MEEDLGTELELGEKSRNLNIALNLNLNVAGIMTTLAKVLNKQPQAET